MEDFHLSSGLFESKYSSSINKRKKNKKKKIKTKKSKNQFKSHTLLNTFLEKINFDFENYESEKTLKLLNVEETDITSNGPKTIKSLSKSLINSLNKKIQKERLINRKEKIFGKIYFESNIRLEKFIKNFIKNLDNKILDTEENINNISNNINDFSYNKLINKRTIEENNLKNKKTNKTLNKKNLSNETLLSLKRNTFDFSNDLYYNKKEIGSSNRPHSFNADELLSISVESFNIEKSYKNINQMTNGVYIKDQKFQDNTIKYINKYYNSKYNIINENIDKEKLNNSNIEGKINNNSNKERKGNFNILKKSVKSVGIKMSQIFTKKNKNSKNNSPKDNKKLSVLNKKSLSSQNLRNNTTKKESINSVYETNENNTTENQNKNDNKGCTQGNINFDETQRINLFKKTKTKQSNK